MIVMVVVMLCAHVLPNPILLTGSSVA